MKKKSDERKELKELKEMKEMNRFEMKNDEMKLELTRRRSSSHFGSQPGAGVKVVAGGHGALMPLRHSVLRGEAKPKPRRQRFRGEKTPGFHRIFILFPCVSVHFPCVFSPKTRRLESFSHGLSPWRGMCPRRGPQTCSKRLRL